jgi:hypothetical protein
MISFEELHKRIHKQYPSVLKATVLGENVFPLYIRANKTPETDFSTRNRKLELLFAHSSHHHSFGYHIETEQIHRRQHGVQDEPVAFYFDTIERYLGYLQKQDEFNAFLADIKLASEAFPMLQTWLATHTQEVIQYHGKWPQLIQVLQYFAAHPKPGLFARELPLKGLGTKFIENHKPILLPLLNLVLPPEAINTTFAGLSQFEQRFGLHTDSPRLRFRWLDKSMAQRYTGGIIDISLAVNELARQTWQVQRVFIVENKTNLLQADVFLTLPQMQGSMAIFGSGRAAVLLSTIPFLHHAEIFYWGDLDAEGFEILNNLLSFLPHAKPFCMDRQTLDLYKNEWVQGSGAQMRELHNLTQEQTRLYEYLVRNNLRLEQEQIHPDWVQAGLRKLLA